MERRCRRMAVPWPDLDIDPSGSVITSGFMDRAVGWIALNMAHRLNRVALHAALQQGIDAMSVLEGADLFSRIAARSGVAADRLLDGAQAEIEKARRIGAAILTYDGPVYPSDLRHIYDPPLALYCLGKVPAAAGLAIVGSRSATHYGINIARSFARDIARHGVPIVSGLARGIDTAAHLGALDSAGSPGGGVTVAVIGSGLLSPYPRENRPLMDKIAKDGAVVSEFPLDTKPIPANFPQRNRILSGLAPRGVLVVEAAERSGALITARLASDQGRDVYAIPGNTTSPMSAGTNRLIQQGAKLVREVDDILCEIPGLDRHPPAPVEALTVEESSVMEHLSADAPTHIDGLAAELDLLPSRLLGTLLALELKNCVRQLPGRFFLRRL
ncbi:MAG: DNA-processing protein DprA [Acidobacteriota bacterium]